jgi:hypothetical protein
MGSRCGRSVAGWPLRLVVAGRSGLFNPGADFQRNTRPLGSHRPLAYMTKRFSITLDDEDYETLRAVAYARKTQVAVQARDLMIRALDARDPAEGDDAKIAARDRHMLRLRRMAQLEHDAKRRTRRGRDADPDRSAPA